MRTKYNELFVNVYNKITEDFFNFIDQEEIYRILEEQTNLAIGFEDKRIKIYSTLLNNGWGVIHPKLIEYGLGKFFVGLSLLDIVNSTVLTQLALNDDRRLYYIENKLSDEYSKEVFHDYLKISFVTFIMGESYKINYHVFQKLKKLFPGNRILENIECYRKFLQNLPKKVLKSNGDMVLVKTNLGDVYLSNNEINHIFSEIDNFEYFYKDEIKVVKDDVVIDGGAYDGKTALVFAKSGAGKVLSFEILKNMIPVISKVLERNDINNVKIINKGLSDIKGKYSMIDRQSGSYLKKNRPGEIEVISIDEFVEENRIEKIDFIKLDIEGEEMNALIGAHKVLKTFKPKIALAAYHEPLHVYEFIKFLSNIGYKRFFLDHKEPALSGLILFAKWE